MNKAQFYTTIEQALDLFAEQPAKQTRLSTSQQLNQPPLQAAFRAFAGVSPEAFFQQLSQHSLKSRLCNGESLLSNHKASEQPRHLTCRQNINIQLTAVSPDELKAAGHSLQFWLGVHDSVYGRCLITHSSRGIHQLAFVDDEHQIEQAITQLKRLWPLATISQDHSVTEPLLTLLFKQQPSRHSTTLSLWLHGSAFQLKVWQALLAIAQGEISSYAAIAQAIKQPRAARAVGSAIGKNPVAWLIPCHRVIPQTGATGGYRWGATRKQAMLGREACQRFEDK